MIVQLKNTSKYRLGLTWPEIQDKQTSGSISIAPEDTGEVEDKIWKNMQDSVAIQSWLAAGWLVPIRTRGSGLAEVLAAVNTAETLDALEALAATEQRPKVLAAIQARAEELAS